MKTLYLIIVCYLFYHVYSRKYSYWMDNKIGYYSFIYSVQHQKLEHTYSKLDHYPFEQLEYIFGLERPYPASKLIDEHHRVISLGNLTARNASGFCVCPRVFIPVCGYNGETYSNECLMNCLNKTTARRDGPCIEYRRETLAIVVYFPEKWTNRSTINKSLVIEPRDRLTKVHIEAVPIDTEYDLEVQENETISNNFFKWLDEDEETEFIDTNETDRRELFYPNYVISNVKIEGLPLQAQLEYERFKLRNIFNDSSKDVGRSQLKLKHPDDVVVVLNIKDLPLDFGYRYRHKRRLLNVIINRTM